MLENVGLPTRVAFTGPVVAVHVVPDPEYAQASSFNSTAACAVGVVGVTTNDVTATSGPRRRAQAASEMARFSAEYGRKKRASAGIG